MDRYNKMNQEHLTSLQRVIGGEIIFLRMERGKIISGEEMIFSGEGMISIVIKKEDHYFKLRIKFGEDREGTFYSEFYEWEKSPPFSERYNAKTGEIKYEYVIDEDLKKFHVEYEIEPKEGEDFIAARKIKSIKVYHFVVNYQNESSFDHVGIIDIETETGRRISIKEEDEQNTYLIFWDGGKKLNDILSKKDLDEGGNHDIYQLRNTII